MPDSSQDKTEQATPKKKEDQRKEGNVLQSKEIPIVTTMIATFFGFALLYPFVESVILDVVKSCMELIETQETLTISDAQNFFIQGLLSFAMAAVPILLIAGLVGILSTVAQTRGLVSFKSMKPKFNRMNPLEGIKRLFSLKGFVELLKSILKIVVLIAVIYVVIKNELPTVPKLIDTSLVGTKEYVGSLILDVVKKVIIAFVFLAAGDYLYQRWQFEKNLRMTKQEVKEEYKNMEGDPQIKGKIKSKQQEMARRRMMQDVPDANVIIRNPTHYAVALKYDPEKHHSPMVIAKGQDSLAMRIVAVAERHDIVTMENKPLARALYAEVDIGKEIPKEYYNAVAEVLAYVYSIKKKEWN